jgi:hypothetical protein
MHTVMNMKLQPASVWIWIALLFATLALAGCNIVTPVFFAVHGPGKVKKAVSLDPELKYIIFVDDPSNKTASRRLRSTIVDTAQSILLQRETVVEMIDGRAAFAAVSKERYSEPMSIVEIGESVGADIVIYALLTEFSLGAEVGTFRPTATMQVKILDVRSGDRIWPVGEKTSYPLRVNLPQKPGLAPSTTSELFIAQEALAEQAGLALAQMFFDVEIPQSARRTR